LWGAWILGRDTVKSLIPFLDTQKNVEWERRWYFDMLVQAFIAIGKMLKPNGHVVFVFDASWHQIIEMLLLAAAGTGFSLDTFLFQPRLGDFSHSEFDDIHGEYRTIFSKSFNPVGVKPLNQIEKEIQQAALEAASEILARRGEPLAFSWVHHAAYVRAMREGLFAEIVKAKPKAPLGRIVHEAVKAGLSEGYARDFDHSASSDQFVWLRRSRELATPLIDRVDEAVREFIAQRNQVFSKNLVSETEDAIYRQFADDLTPEAGLIELCASAAKSDAAEKTRALEMLAKLGERLGFQVSGFKFQGSEFSTTHYPLSTIHSFDLAWLSDGELAHGFIWRDHATFADLAQVHIAPAQGYLVIPESAVELLKVKTKRLPPLVESFTEAGWRFARVPFIEKLSRQETVERNDLIFITGLEPPSLELGAQLELFDDAA